MTGCGLFVKNITGGLAENLSLAISNNNDLQTVKDGCPAYLLMIDAFVGNNPDDASMLRTAADLYTTYASFFVSENSRALKLTDKALDYAFRACCKYNSKLCSLPSQSFKDFSTTVSLTKKEDIPFLFTLGSAWANWIQVRSGDINALAQISRIEVIMQHVIKLDEFYKDGAAHLFMGGIAILLPPALGGKPAIAQKHFKRAIEIDGNKNLMVKVIYAKQYARMMFDQELHDRLLNEVLNSNVNISGYTLINTLAKIQAKELLDNGKDYF